jgi:PAS domain S-box-containing protein
MTQHMYEQQAALRSENEALITRLEAQTTALAQANASLREQIDARERCEALLATERNILRALVDHLPDRVGVKDTAGQYVLVNAAMREYLGATAPEQLAGTSSPDIRPADGAAQLDGDEQAIVRSGQPLINQEEALAHDATGARSWALTTKVPVRDSQGAIIGLVSISRDITRRKQAEQHLALRFAVSRTVSESETRQVAVPKLLEAICTAIGCDLGEIWRVDAHTNRLRWEGAWHQPSLQAAPFVNAESTLIFGPGSDLPGQVWAAGQPLSLADAPADVASPWRSLAAGIGLSHGVGLPIRGGSTVLGVLVFWSRAPRLYDAELLTTLADLGNQIGLFFDRMRAEERLRQYVRRIVDAQEAERDHIARELHDEIAQALALIKMNVRAVQRLAHESDLVPHLEQSLGIIEETLQHVRTLAVDLRPSMLDDLGLVTTLRWYVDRHAKWAALDAEVLVEAFEARIPPHLETVCFRVAQEALSNIARHAQAHAVRIKLAQREGAVHMLIRDDGIGFDVLSAQEQAADGASIGLLGMEDRVLLAGGQLVIESAPGRGTTVWLRLPLGREVAADDPAARGD